MDGQRRVTADSNHFLVVGAGVHAVEMGGALPRAQRRGCVPRLGQLFANLVVDAVLGVQECGMESVSRQDIYHVLSAPRKQFPSMTRQFPSRAQTATSKRTPCRRAQTDAGTSRRGGPTA